VIETLLRVSDHPINAGIADFTIRDEFYYRLKFPTDRAGIQPLWTAMIDGEPNTVAWAYERPDGGRSFGFSGLHFDDNWQRPEYQRLVTQGVRWTLKLPPGSPGEADRKPR
jgi:type 1 glutamine amidotransferase